MEKLKVIFDEKSEMKFMGNKFFRDENKQVWGNLYYVKLNNNGRGLKLTEDIKYLSTD